jgi:hypothetical protein
MVLNGGGPRRFAVASLVAIEITESVTKPHPATGSSWRLHRDGQRSPG